MQAENCDTSQKLGDVTAAVLENMQDLCQCGFVRDRITSEAFRCFPASLQAVTYRAILHGTANITSSELISMAEQWTAKGVGIIIQQILLEVDGSCTVALSSIVEEECRKRPQNADSFKSSSNTAGIIGGTVTTAVILISFAIVVVIIILSVCKHRAQTNPSQSSVNNNTLRCV